MLQKGNKPNMTSFYLSVMPWFQFCKLGEKKIPNIYIVLYSLKKYFHMYYLICAPIYSLSKMKLQPIINQFGF